MVYDNHLKGLRKGTLEIQNEVRKKKKKNTNSKGSECNTEHTPNTCHLVSNKYTKSTEGSSEPLPLLQQTTSLFPWLRLNFAKLTALGRLVNKENLSNFEV